MRTLPSVLLGVTLLLVLSGCTRRQAATADKTTVSPVQQSRSNVERDIRFLAADEMRGRDTGSPELERAARYLADELRKAGVYPLPGASGYLQNVQLENSPPIAGGNLQLADSSYQLNADFVALRAVAGTHEGRIVFFEYGTAEELGDADLTGAIVVVNAGGPDVSNPRSFFPLARAKRAAVAERGGVALVELFRSTGIPWSALTNYFGGGSMKVATGVDEGPKLPHVWLHDPNATAFAAVKANRGAAATLSLAVPEKTILSTSNVIGYVKGTDAQLQETYVLLSAHYDHVGVDASRGAQDSIFNGARDNAIGTAALLQTAREIAANPPKRSVVFAAWTAEEKGLLGSEYYTLNPLVPLKQTVFNLNMDGAGYDDTTSISIIGTDRTSVQAALAAAATANGLTAGSDPAPEQNLYDRSDNVNFAAAGIPSVNLAPGTTGFTPEILKYYHQVEDEADNLNFDYLNKYTRTIIAATQAVANTVDVIAWTPGDKYEAAGKELYGPAKD